MVEPLQGNTTSEYIVPGAHDEDDDAGKTEFSQPKKRDLLTVLMIYNYLVGNIWR